jgi:hypothetical protein
MSGTTAALVLHWRASRVLGGTDMTSTEILAFFVVPFVAIGFGWLITLLPD